MTVLRGEALLIGTAFDLRMRPYGRFSSFFPRRCPNSEQCKYQAYSLLSSRPFIKGLNVFGMKDTRGVKVYLLYRFSWGEHRLSGVHAYGYKVQRMKGLSLTRVNNPSADCHLFYLSKLRKHGRPNAVVADNGEGRIHTDGDRGKIQAVSPSTL